MEKVITIIRKTYPITVIRMKTSDLDINHCSNKFLNHIETSHIDEVFVKCNADGTIDYRGNKQEYRIYDISKHDMVNNV